MNGGSELVRIDSSGRLLVGTSSSSADTRAIIQGRSSAGDSTGRLYISSGNNTPGDGDGIAELYFSPSNHTATARIAVQRDGGTWTAGSSQPSRLVFSTTADGASSPTERLRITNGGKVWLGFTSSPSSGTDTPGLELRAPNTTSGQWTFLMMASNNSTVALGYDNSGSIRSDVIFNATTSNAANMQVDANGIIRRSTSSAKYKTNIETLEDSYADALLQCRPVWYQSTCEADNPDWGYWGFIAEEVAQIDPRLVHWKTTKPAVQEGGSIEHVACDPEPEGVQYDRFVPHLLNLIKRQGEAITELQAEVAALKAS
jgi:hypothetical protein